MRRALFVVALALDAAGVGAQTPVPPKLEAFLSYPFVSNLVASEDGSALSWIENRKGVRNIWMARAPDFRPRQVTDNGEDDGQELTNLAWAGDGKSIVWVRGGDHHKNGWAQGSPPPNARSDPDEPKIAIWYAALSGGPAVQIAEGDFPTISTRGELAYVKGGQAWTADLQGRRAPLRMFYDRGRAANLAWSPDGTRLAFVSERGDHNFVGVYAGAGKPITWLAPSTLTDDDPVWSPDSKKIAFSRRVTFGGTPRSPLVERPRPFSIWVASADDGTGRAAWKSPATLNGSYPALPDGLDLMWGAGDRITFVAELDGWPNLYAVPAAGGATTRLTAGSYMVEHVAMSADRKQLYYAANDGRTDADIDRRHVFRVAVDTPGAVAITSGKGLEWTPAPLAEGRVAYIGSTPTTPMGVMLGTESGKPQPIGAPAPDYPSADLVVPSPVTFRASDGLLIHGQMFTPKKVAGKMPAIVFAHGGPTRQMLLGWSYMDYYAHAYAMNQYLASRGFVVLSVNYRLGIGYGRAFQHAQGAGVAGAAEYLDILAGARYLRTAPGVDPARIGIWGGSYGGLLVAKGLALNSDVFKAGVDLHGVHDRTLKPSLSEPPDRYEQGDWPELPKSAFESTAMANVKTWKSPVLLIQGDHDGNVNFNQTIDLARRLDELGVRYEELVLPNEVHGFLRYDSWLKSDVATVRFLEAELKPGLK